MSTRAAHCLFVLTLIGDAAMAQMVQDDPVALRGIGVQEHLGDHIPLDLEFVSADGDTVAIEDYFVAGRPVILIMGYYTCPMLCNLVFNGVVEAVKPMPWRPGNEFQIISVSIDPTETDVVASAKRDNYITAIGKPGIREGWDFLTGREDQSRALADAIGFQYYWDEDQKQFAHPAVITLVSPDGTISRYLYGIEYTERDVRLGLMEASEGKVGSTLQKIILSCYHYDPEAGSYVLFAAGLMRLGGIATAAVLGILMGSLWFRERRRRKGAG